LTATYQSKKEMVEMTTAKNNVKAENNFKAEIIKEVGRVVISNTQEIRTLLVRDENLGLRVSCQKWWRESTDKEWKAGKGFFLSGREAVEVGEALQAVGNEIIHIKS
jgi:hypothetical protein